MRNGSRKTKSLMEITFDLDAYLADGGKLSDLELPTDEESQARVKAFARASSSDETLHRMVRVGRFLQRLGDESPSESAQC
jgi:hypothetical protein